MTDPLQSVLPPGPNDPAEPMVLEVAVAARNAVWNICRPLKLNHRADLFKFWIKTLSSFEDNILPLKVSA